MKFCMMVATLYIFYLLHVIVIFLYLLRTHFLRHRVSFYFLCYLLSTVSRDLFAIGIHFCFLFFYANAITTP